MTPVNTQVCPISSLKFSACPMGTNRLIWGSILSSLNLARGYFRHWWIMWKESSSAPGWAFNCLPPHSYVPPEQAGIFLFIFFPFYQSKITLLSILANKIREQHGEKPYSDGHVRMHAALIGHPSHRMLPSPLGLELIISFGFPKWIIVFKISPFTFHGCSALFT